MFIDNLQSALRGFLTLFFTYENSEVVQVSEEKKEI